MTKVPLHFTANEDGSSGKSAGQVNVPVEETFSTQFSVAFDGFQAEKLTLMLFSYVQPKNMSR